jgi:CheY-like chemotaxis protein/DNA-binding Xre family transcriptional regulator
MTPEVVFPDLEFQLTNTPVPMHDAAPARGVAQPGSAFGSGPKGRRFKSSRPDRKGAAASRLKVLVVDDDDATCEMLHDALYEFQLTCQSDPRRAAEQLEGGTYHVALLDLHMPQMSGIDLLARIRRFDKDIAVVIITGRPTMESATASIEHQVAAYVKKPIDIARLRATLLRIARDKGILLESPAQMLAAVGKNVRDLRIKRDLSLRQLSRRSGLSPSVLSSIERAAVSASLSSLLRVSAALGVRLRDLFDDL